MTKLAVRHLLLLVVFSIFCTSRIFSQTIATHDVDAGPYAPGSTVAIPFHVDNGTSFIDPTNSFTLVMSDASGNFSPGTTVATLPNSFYATYFNYTLPAGTAAGSYKFIVKASNPAISSAASTAITVNATGTAPTAGVSTSPAIGSGGETFGQCNNPSSPYFFSSTSTNATATTASFFNEGTQTMQVSNQAVTIYVFAAQTTNYTIIAKAKSTDGVTYSTKAYQLINNKANASLPSSGNNTACLTSGSALLTFGIDYTSAAGIQFNYPGDTYTISWGDGSAPTTYTLAQLVSLSGIVSHPYSRVSCGNVANRQNNSFEVDLDVSNKFCGTVGTRATSYVKIVIKPTTFTAPPASGTACINTAVTFVNGSIPGPDPNASAASCAENPNARYIWLVDGTVQGANYPRSQDFVYTFTTNGTHTITLREQVGNGICPAADYTTSICIQNPPTAAFTIPAGPVCSTSPITPINTSTVDPGCSPPAYKWTITPSTYTLAAGSSLTSSTPPTINFTAADTYTIGLTITPTSCNPSIATQTIAVDTPPTVTLPASADLCGTTQTLTFDNTAGSATRVTYAGSGPASTVTYSWAVTLPPGGNFVFTGGTTAASQYPKIQFTGAGTYTVSVTATNSCGSSTVQTENINLQLAPALSAGAALTICKGSTVSLTATVTSGTLTSQQWSSPTNSSGSAFSSQNSLTTVYTPTAADIANGSVTLTITGQTGSVGACATVSSTVTITIVPTDRVTSAPSKTICSGGNVGYNIAASDGTSTYSWTASVTTGAATGFSASGTSATINDVITNSNPLQDAVVTYVITPISSVAPTGSTTGCPGTPFIFTVNIPAVPTITPTVANALICSGSQTGISFSSNKTGTKYTWSVSMPAGVTGGNNVITPTTSSSITDVLVNATAANATVAYTVTAYNSNGCAGTPLTVSVDVAPAPTTANAGPNQTLCGATTTTLGGNNPSAGAGKWTVISGTGVTFTDDTSPTSVITGLTVGSSYRLQWTITTASGCSSSSIVDISVVPATVGGSTAAVGSAAVCAPTNTGQIRLTGQTGSVLRWESSKDGGTTWQTSAVTSATLNFSNLTQTTQYRAVVQNGSCTIETSTVTTITVNQPPPTANAGPDQILCGVTTANLSANNPGSYTGAWTQISGPAVSIVNPNSYQTAVNGLTDGTTYSFIWTINGQAPCVNSQSQVNITVTSQTVGGSTASANGNSVCSGTNTGQINLTGQVGNILRWESSTNNGTTWAPIANNSTSITFTNLTQTTQYRAVVQSGTCLILMSSVTTITANPPAPIADAGPNQILCNATTATLAAATPGTFIGVWQQTSGPAVTFANANDPKTTVSGLIGGNTYTFNWTISAQAPCTNTQSQVTITDNPDVVANFTFTPKVGCGDLTVQFANTSNNQPGANFLWDFGDGSTSTSVSPQHTFAQRTDGRDTVYKFSLSIPGNCKQRAPLIDSVLVRPAVPLAQILPVNPNGCGNFALDVRNVSPGNNISYDFYLYDGSTLIQKISKTDKSNAVFNPISTTARKTFTLYMIATGYCNTTGETLHIPITISPSTVAAQMFIANNVNSGCVPLSVSFQNNSFGGDSFHYNIYDSNNKIVDQPIAGLTALPYTFSNAGTYYVTITAANSCGTQESPRIRLDVNPLPTPAFAASDTTGCNDVKVTFINKTASNDLNTPASSLGYDWDFGDGTPHSASFQPVHTFNSARSPYTVTLKVTNLTTGCSNITSRIDYIKVEAPPGSQFIAQPDSVVSIPNYRFSFVDKTTGSPVAWKWTFSDGQTSTLRNPQITFADTGKYKVTLTTRNRNGCDSTISHTVQITGVPGQLYLPNAFIPSSATEELRTFRAKGSGIKTWHLQIFNGYGALVWETTKLSSKGEPVDGWDGTYKGVPAPQGVYVWQASATFINGTEWKGMSYDSSLPKRVGSIHLLR